MLPNNKSVITQYNSYLKNPFSTFKWLSNLFYFISYSTFTMYMEIITCWDRLTHDKHLGSMLLVQRKHPKSTHQASSSLTQPDNQQADQSDNIPLNCSAQKGRGQLEIILLFNNKHSARTADFVLIQSNTKHSILESGLAQLILLLGTIIMVSKPCGNWNMNQKSDGHLGSRPLNRSYKIYQLRAALERIKTHNNLTSPKTACNAFRGLSLHRHI